MVNKREIAVLVVDDDRFVREMISEILIDQGVSVFQAENGRNALVIFSEHEKIDIIVTHQIYFQYQLKILYMTNLKNLIHKNFLKYLGKYLSLM